MLTRLGLLISNLVFRLAVLVVAPTWVDLKLTYSVMWKLALLWRHLRNKVMSNISLRYDVGSKFSCSNLSL